VMVPQYQKVIVDRMPNIKVLDSTMVPADQRRAAESALKARKSKFIASQTPEESLNNQVCLDIELRLLQNIEGAKYLIPDENCALELEKLDAIPVENKSSLFWLTYTNHFGSPITSEKKSYIEDF